MKAEQRAYNGSPAGVLKRRSYQQQRTSRDKFKANIWAFFRLTVEDYARLLHRQGFKCGCCSAALDCGKQTHVDHDHESGRPRALLCHCCNTALGLLNDSPERIQQLLQYSREQHVISQHGYVAPMRETKKSPSSPPQQFFQLLVRSAARVFPGATP